MDLQRQDASRAVIPWIAWLVWLICCGFLRASCTPMEERQETHEDCLIVCMSRAWHPADDDPRGFTASGRLGNLACCTALLLPRKHFAEFCRAAKSSVQDVPLGLQRRLASSQEACASLSQR